MANLRVKRRASFDILGGKNDIPRDSASVPREWEGNSGSAEGSQKSRNVDYSPKSTIGISADTSQVVQESYQIEGEDPEARALEETGMSFTCADCKFPLKHGEPNCPACKAELVWEGISA